MSNYERNVGKLKPVTMTAKKLELILGKMVSEVQSDGFDINDEDQWREIIGEYGLPYALLGDDWYYIIEHRNDRNVEGWAEVTKHEDGTYSFDTYHYNGGAHWTEVVEDELKKING